MVEVNDKAIRDLMINMYPQKNTKASTDFGTEINILNELISEKTQLKNKIFETTITKAKGLK